MEKGFNDDELADIMNEIESLEKEFSDEVQGVDEAVLDESTNIASQEEPMTEDAPVQFSNVQPEETTSQEEVKAEVAPHINHEEAEVAQDREVISELTKIPVEEVVAKHKPQDDNVHPISQHNHFSHSKMDFSIEGEMSLNFNFHVSGQTVKLHIEEGNFAIELEGGMKFILPLEQNQVKKAA